MTNPKISIIIPVFNVEKYLNRCLDSIIKQSLPEFEVVLVDDGSDDLSGSICDDYVARDSRFCVIHKLNEGVSVARNKGIDKSKADWLLFIDADDELLQNSLELLYGNARADIDLVGASYIRYEDGVLVSESHECMDRLLSREQYVREISYYRFRNCERYCWNKLFRRSIIVENGISFDRTLAYREDVVFLYSYLLHCKKSIKCIKEPVYVYYRRSNGAAMTHLSSYTPKSKGVFVAAERCLQMVQEDEKLHDSVEQIKSDFRYSYYHLRMLIENSNDKEIKKEQRVLWKRLKKYLTVKEIITIRVKELLRPIYKRIKK